MHVYLTNFPYMNQFCNDYYIKPIPSPILPAPMSPNQFKSLMCYSAWKRFERYDFFFFFPDPTALLNEYAAEEQYFLPACFTNMFLFLNSITF